MQSQQLIPTALLDTSHVNKNLPPFVLVDGSYYMFRTFYGLRADLKTSKGLHTNALRGTLNSLKKLINRYQPTHMAVAFDTSAPTFRHELSPIYKGDRSAMPDELAEQVPYLHRMIKALGIPVLAIEGVEADDIIGTLAHRACLEGYPVVISTGDKDMCQLVNDCIVVENSFDDKLFDIAGVQAKFGVKPSQIIDLLTLMGDKSDGIQGVAGIGDKTAVKLLETYGSVNNLLENIDQLKGKQKENLSKSHDSIAIDRQLATIITNLPIIDDWHSLKINDDPVALKNEQLAIFTELEFKGEIASLNHPNHPANIVQLPTPQPKKVDKNWQTITNIQDFEKLLNKLQNAPYFAVDTETTSLDWQHAELVGLSFALQAHEAFYVPVAHVDELGNLLPNQLDKHMVLQQLKPILENPNIGKIGQHLKYDSHILQRYQIDLNISYQNWQMDTMLASYVLNTVATKHNLDDLARHYLQTTTTTFEDIAGKGTKQITFDKVSLPIASNYACEDADITFQLFEKFSNLFKNDDNTQQLLTKIEIPVAQILCKMETDGILVDKNFLQELSVKFDEQIQQLENIVYQQAGETFNLASPKQLGEILFEKLQLSGSKKTKTGQYSTNEAILSNIDHPIIDTILEYRSLAKLKSTYTNALAQVADHKNRVHTSYHQALTSTGRLSSTEPNLQNIPIRTDTGRLIRQAFIAPPNCVLLSADYSQIELRLMAHFANDPVLIQAFQQGHDIHRATASEVLGKPFAEVTAEERRQAKAINFGLLYGMSQFGLAKQLNFSREEAQNYIVQYFTRYPNVRQYMENIRHLALDQQYVETILGRKIYTPDLQNGNMMVRQSAERSAINAPLQGSASDIIKLAMIAIQDLFDKENLHSSAKMLLQVHDELVFEVNSDKAEVIGKQIQTAMQNVFTDTAKQLGWDIDFAVPLVVEVGIGENWDTAH